VENLVKRGWQQLLVTWINQLGISMDDDRELTANCTLWQGLINMALCTNLVDAPDDDEKNCL